MSFSPFKARIWHHPILAGTLSSIFASSLAALITKATTLQSLTVPLWVLIFVVSAFLAFLIVLIFLLLAFYQLRGTRVIMALSAFRSKYWYSEILQSILVDLAPRGIDVIVKIPRLDYAPASQADIFNDILAHHHHYTAGIVVPVEPHATKHEILTFTRLFAKPVLFLDVEPFESESDYPPRTAFFGYDNEVGGALAAQAMHQYLNTLHNSQPRILIIGSTAQTGRQSGFENALKRLMPQATITRRDDGHFAREYAKRIAQHYVRQSEQSWPFNAVYCTNDEMALGIIEVLLALPKNQSDSIIVIGYDGLDEALLTIERGNIPLRNTVVQDPVTLAAEAVQILLRLLHNQEVSKVVNKRLPHLYRNVEL